MKKHLLLLIGASLLALNVAVAQRVGGLPSMSAPEGYVLVKDTNSLPKFDLDFPGGMPKDLVRAVEKATDKPLNVIIPDDCADLKIPHFSVKNVTVEQLFKILTLASKSTRRYDLMDPTTGGISGQEHASTYGFQTEGVPNEQSIWFFNWDRNVEPFQVIASKVCRFYQLSPYLEAGYKVDDITTAVETGWKMFGVTNAPQISYHKDTKVLIAVGEQDKVNLIGDVLKQLSTTPKEKLDGKDSSKSKDE
jgi:hypothetical protein